MVVVKTLMKNGVFKFKVTREDILSFVEILKKEESEEPFLLNFIVIMVGVAVSICIFSFIMFLN